MKKLIEEFNFERKNIKSVSDYEAFENKDVLDELRIKIIENLISQNNQQKSLKELIKQEIKKATENYDLSSIEINYLHNLINNEVHGYGPLTELLEDEAITEIMVNQKDEGPAWF